MNKTCVQLLDTLYLDCCNGEWEHHYGIRIETCDNPGWLLSFNDSRLDGVWTDEIANLIANGICEKYNIEVTCNNNELTQEIVVFSRTLEHLLAGSAELISNINKVRKAIH